MRLYDCTASCLVDDIVLHYPVIAKNEIDAWNQGYEYYNFYCTVADGGTVDVKRVVDYSKYCNIDGKIRYKYY